MELKDWISVGILIVQTFIFIIQTFIFNKQKLIFKEQSEIINSQNENQSKSSKVQAYYNLIEHISRRDYYTKAKIFIQDKTMKKEPRYKDEVWEMTNMVCYLFNTDSIDFDLFKVSLRYHIDGVVEAICKEKGENPENCMDAISCYWRTFCKLNPVIERT